MTKQYFEDKVLSQLNKEVIQSGLCTHCGTCVGLSNNALIMKSTESGPLPEINELTPLKLSQTCYDACPGKGLNYPGLNEYVFAKHPDNWLMGCYRSLNIGYSNDAKIRKGAASGGVITQTLVYLLEQGLIDGAVLVQQGIPKPWQATPVIAQSIEDIIKCSQSVYAPVPVNSIFGQMDTFKGVLAYVGLPDQVASLRFLQSVGHAGALKVDYILGPYVGMNMYFDSIKSFLRSNGIQDLDDIAELRYREGEWPGYLQIVTHSGKIIKAEKFYYNYLLPFYVTRSTLLSVDFTNELTDISVGDAWSPKFEQLRQGFSVVVARSSKGENLLNEMHSEGCISLDVISLDEALSMHGHMLDFKKRGAFIRMAWWKASGKRTPEYGYRPSSIPLSRKAVEVIIAIIFALCGTRLARKVIEFIPIEIMGPIFNLLRKVWKNASKTTKRKGLQEQSYEIDNFPQKEKEYLITVVENVEQGKVFK